MYCHFNTPNIGNQILLLHISQNNCASQNQPKQYRNCKDIHLHSSLHNATTVYIITNFFPSNSLDICLWRRKPKHRQKRIFFDDPNAAALTYVSLCEQPFLGLTINNRIFPIMTYDEIICFLCYILLRYPSTFTDPLKSFFPLIKHKGPGYSDMFSLYETSFTIISVPQRMLHTKEESISALLSKTPLLNLFFDRHRHHITPSGIILCPTHCPICLDPDIVFLTFHKIAYGCRDCGVLVYSHCLRAGESA